MKFLLVVAAVVAVAVAGPTQRGLVAPAAAGAAPVLLPEIVSVGPAIVDIPVADTIIPEPVAVGPALIDFPLTASGEAITAVPSPVSIVPAGAASLDNTGAALVQIILNINQASSAEVSPAPVAVSPAVIAPVEVVERPVAQPAWDGIVDPVQVVDHAPIDVSPVQVVDVAPVEVSPVQVVEVAPVAVEPVLVATPVIPVEPVQVVEVAPVAVEPVIIGTPIIPVDVVSLPDELN